MASGKSRRTGHLVESESQSYEAGPAPQDSAQRRVRRVTTAELESPESIEDRTADEQQREDVFVALICTVALSFIVFVAWLISRMP
jgi:hypothetical protein